jgi:hypothetical protein
MNRGPATTFQSIQEPTVFLTENNFEMLLNHARNKVIEREGEVNNKVNKRLQNVLQHYMREVSKMNPGRKVMDLNREVIRETLTSMDSWFRRGGETNSTSADIFRGPAETERIFSNVGNQLASLQKERGMSSNPVPVTKPDFTDKVEEDAIDPMALFEAARKQREKEGMVIKPFTTSNTNMVPMKSPDYILRDDSPEYKTPQTLPQDVIIRQQDITKYKEIEYNIFLNSGDRNWLLNTAENRYNFSINFNVANNTNDYTYSPSLQERFKNIVRIETVKTIISLESLQTLVRKPLSNTTDTDSFVNALSYQYVAMRIGELNGNGFGTNSRLDNSFAVLHQDTAWSTDATNKRTRGYASLAPKYLKCQKVYAPTPLASLQKLSIRLERPDGNLLTEESDVIRVNQVVPASAINAYAGGTATSAYVVGSPDNEYIFIQASSWFSKFAIADADRIIFRNFTIGITGTGTVTPQTISDFTSWMNRTEGHYVVGIAYSSGSGVVIDGANDFGYANYIVIRSRFADPTTGSVSRSYFGNTTNDTELAIRLRDGSSRQTNSALLNMNRQTHIVLRVICREMDSASNLRPDNT